MAPPFENPNDHAIVVDDQAGDRCVVADLDPFACTGLMLGFHQSGTATPGFDGQPAPELATLAVDRMRLVSVARLEAHALAA